MKTIIRNMVLLAAGAVLLILPGSTASGADLDLKKPAMINPALVSGFNANIQKLNAGSLSLRNMAPRTATMDIANYNSVQKEVMAEIEGLFTLIKTLKNQAVGLRGYGDVTKIQEWQDMTLESKINLEFFDANASDPPTVSPDLGQAHEPVPGSMEFDTTPVAQVNLPQATQIGTLCAYQANCVTMWRINCEDCCQAKESPFGELGSEIERTHCLGGCMAQKNNLATECMFKAFLDLMKTISGM